VSRKWQASQANTQLLGKFAGHPYLFE